MSFFDSMLPIVIKLSGVFKSHKKSAHLLPEHEAEIYDLWEKLHYDDDYWKNLAAYVAWDILWKDIKSIALNLLISFYLAWSSAGKCFCYTIATALHLVVFILSPSTTNWEDLTCSMGYSLEQFLGFFYFKLILAQEIVQQTFSLLARLILTLIYITYCVSCCMIGLFKNVKETLFNNTDEKNNISSSIDLLTS